MRFILFTIYLSAAAVPAFGQNLCADFKTYQQLVDCAVSNSPEVQNSKLELQRAKAQVQAAGQWKNPEFSGQTLSGKAGNDDVRETDLALGIPIELGGKISARKSLAESGVALSEANLYETQARVKITTFLKLHRLRQVLHEQEIADEAIKTFSRLIAQYSKRPALSPEQQLSMSVYGLSKSEYDLKKSATDDEVQALNTYFKNHLGLSIDQLKDRLPSSPSQWPQVTVANDKGNSPQARIFEAELNAAKAELSAAQSEAWPTLTVGPSYKMQSEGGLSNNMMGVNLSLPLPLFNMNGAAKAAANAGVQLNETKRQLGLREQGFKREELERIYNFTIKVLASSLSHDEIEKRHTQSEVLFMKGVAPSSLVIETHRTSYELEKTRHERELKALESLLEIYVLDGTILEKNI